MELITILNDVQRAIFEYKINYVQSNIMSIAEKLSKAVESSGKVDRNEFNQILGNVEIALRNNDYLLLADIVEFELVDLVKRL